MNNTKKLNNKLGTEEESLVSASGNMYKFSHYGDQYGVTSKR